MLSPRHQGNKYTSSLSFMQPISSSSSKTPILSSVFQGNHPFNDQCKASLFEKHVELQFKNQGLFKISLNFSVKFSIDDGMLSFLNDIEESILLKPKESCIYLWEKQLKRRICQKHKSTPFKIIKRIFVGNHCAIYLAEQSNEKGCTEPLVVKAYRKASLAKGNHLEAFKNEIEIMQRVRNENLCRLHGVYQSENSYYICMAYYNGGNLLQKNMKQPFSKAAVKDIMFQILKGLDYLHERKIVHRDIKPENILLKKSSDHQIAIIDFGLATYTDIPEQMQLKCGTPGYVAPQIFKSSSSNLYNQKCDLYSVGMLMFFLLSKRLPYKAKNEDQMKKQNYYYVFSPQNHPQLAGVSHEALSLLEKLLKRDPKQRISAKQALSHKYFSDYRSCGQKDYEIKNRYYQEVKINY